jgi:VIT1/CCC1 family predicted Fe2+/Mn2+ transporter
VASNAGARFSESGFSTLVRRSETDDVLAEKVGMRADIPAPMFRELLARASEQVRRKLSELGANDDQVPELVSQIAESMEAEAGVAERDYAPAHRRLDPMHRAGQLDIGVIEASARAGSFEEVVVGVSFLCGVPIPVIERALTKKDQELFMILAKACRMTWATVKCIMVMLSVTRGMPKIDLDRSFESYNRVQSATAQRVVRFMRVRKTASQ